MLLLLGVIIYFVVEVFIVSLVFKNRLQMTFRRIQEYMY